MANFYIYGHRGPSQVLGRSTIKWASKSGRGKKDYHPPKDGKLSVLLAFVHCGGEAAVWYNREKPKPGNTAK
jgi:hypothetical protein